MYLQILHWSLYNFVKIIFLLDRYIRFNHKLSLCTNVWCLIDICQLGLHLTTTFSLGSLIKDNVLHWNNDYRFLLFYEWNANRLWWETYPYLRPSCYATILYRKYRLTDNYNTHTTVPFCTLSQNCSNILTDLWNNKCTST